MARHSTASNARSDKGRPGADPLSPADLEASVHDALDHLHDLPYLQRHPLALRLGGKSRRSGVGRTLQQALLDGIESLRPGREVSPESHAWRGHRILHLRYVEGLDVVAVYGKLAISRREYYRDHRKAIEALALILEGRLEQVSRQEDETGSDRRDREISPASGRHSQLAVLPSSKPAPSNLPLQLTSFVGREREMAEVRRLLGTTRLLTLTGSGGCGKTRLACHVAEELLRDRPEEHPDGVWVAELAPLGDPGLVPQAVAFALGLREVSGQPILDTLQGYLKPRRLLLVLDNCEHLLDACASLADALLRRCPGLTVLATSREALGIGGETSWRVPSLSLPNSTALPSIDQLLDYEAVRLFVDRAKAAQPDFDLSERNAAAVVTICERLDGMPLALELAAARLRAMSVEQIAGYLDDRFRLLTSGSRAALPRQQTLRATIDWSYDLLDEPERALLRRLSAFSGGWTIEAAEQVSAGEGLEGEDVLDLLTRLVDKSLILVETRDGETRYRLLETIRQYGQERLLASGETERVRRAHFECYLGSVKASEPELHGPRQREVMDRLERERDNLRAALQWSLEVREVERGLRMALALYDFWVFRGPFGEANATMTSLLDLPGARESALGPSAAALHSILSAKFASQEVWRPRLDEARHLAETRDDRLAVAHSIWASAFNRNDTRTGRSELLDARATFVELGQSHWVYWCDWLLASNSARVGEFGEAQRLFDSCLVTARELGSPAFVGQALVHLGSLSGQRGGLVQARGLLEESVRYLEESGYDSHLFWGRVQLARVLRLLGAYQRAGREAVEARDLATRVGEPDQIAAAELELGLLASAGEDHDLARHHLERSLDAWRVTNRPDHLAELWSYQGIVARARGDLAEASRLLSESLAMNRDLGARFEIALCLSNLGVVALDEGALDEARAHLAEGLVLRREMGAKTGIATSLECVGGLAAHERKGEKAIRLLGAGARLREITENIPPPVWRRQRDLWLELASRELDPERADAVWADGHAMTLEQAVEYALA